MFSLCTVARFARNHHMLALFLLLTYVGMAGLANIVAGEGHGPCGDFRNGVATIMPILSKAPRDDQGAQCDECNQCDCHDRREPNQVFNVFEQVVRPIPDASRATGRDPLGYLGIVAEAMIEVTGMRDRGHDAPSRRWSFHLLTMACDRVPRITVD